jgi:hypothetical protein
MIFGLGSLVANSVCPMLTGMFTVDKVVNYKGMFMVPTALSLLAAIVLALFFRPPVKQAPAPAA